MTKFRLYFNKDKETTWLNNMAKEGYALTKFIAGFYTFEACEPGEYEYQIDFGDKLYAVTDDYREFMEENNIEIVCFIMETFAAMNGVAVGFFGMVIIGALIIALMIATLSTKKTINELKERKGEPINKGIAGGNISPTLVAGLFLNLCATALNNSSITGSWITIVQIIAIIIMLIGIYQSRGVFAD